MDPNPEICRWKLTIQYGPELNIVPWLSLIINLINRTYGMTYLTRSQWWLGQRRMWLVKSMRPSLPMPFETSSPISASAVLNSKRHPHDPCWPATEREAQGLALHCGRLRGVKSSGDTEAVRADRTQARQQVWKVCVRAKSLSSVYFWAHACYCAINNGWGRWWECSTGNRKRHPCHPLKSRNSEYSGEGKKKKKITFLSLKSAVVHLQCCHKNHLFNYLAITADFLIRS